MEYIRIKEKLYLLGNEVNYGKVYDDGKITNIWSHTDRTVSGLEVLEEFIKTDLFLNDKKYIVFTDDNNYAESIYISDLNKFDIENFYPIKVIDVFVSTSEMSGVDLIMRERKEQIEKHGWSLDNDADYGNNELIKAALFAINPTVFEWPFNWTEEFREKIINKPNDIERLKVAGALIAAEIDRLK